MSERWSVRRALLGRTYAYALFRKVLRADRATKLIVRDHIRPTVGARVLDLGCGNGELAHYFDGVRYVGVDHNGDYVAAAQRRSVGTDDVFVNADLENVPLLDIGTFDIVVALGVLHHLETSLATAVIDEAARRLRPGGRLVTLDPAFEPSQRATARVLMALDRGQFVRHPEDYDRLVAGAFSTRSMVLRTDLVPFPYTHCIIEARV